MFLYKAPPLGPELSAGDAPSVSRLPEHLCEAKCGGENTGTGSGFSFTKTARGVIQRGGRRLSKRVPFFGTTIAKLTER